MTELREQVEDASDPVAVRDDDGCIFWVEATDDDGLYFHDDSPDAASYRCSWEQAVEWFVLADEEDI